MAVSKKETVKVETTTAEVKPAETKAAEVKPAAATSAVPKKDPAEKKAEPVKKAPADKKVPAKKAAEPKTSVVIEYAGNQVSTKAILAAAKKAFTKANKGVEIKTMEVYVKPEEGLAYYVVNGAGSDDFKVSL